MSGRTRVTLSDGRRVTGFRKTLRRNPRSFDPFSEADPSIPFVLRVALPLDIVVAAGPTGIVGVTVDDLRYLQAQGHGLEWVFRQASDFLGTVCGGINRELKFSVERGAYRAGGTLIYVPGASVIFPRAVKKALVFEVKR